MLNGSMTVSLPQCLNHFDTNHRDIFVPVVKTNSRISATTTTNPWVPQVGSSTLAQKHAVFYLSYQMCICAVRTPIGCNNRRASLGVSMVESQQTNGSFETCFPKGLIRGSETYHQMVGCFWPVIPSKWVQTQNASILTPDSRTKVWFPKRLVTGAVSCPSRTWVARER